MVSGKMKIALINTDENQQVSLFTCIYAARWLSVHGVDGGGVQTAVEYGIRSIPTLILFNKGVRLETIIGAVPKATLEAKLSQHLLT